jgi:aminoglycoside phosphotransferase family enzyme/predicted kinase
MEQLVVDLAPLIDALSKPDAYPFPVKEVEVHQTHISVVFLAGRYAYKIKKPVNLGFLDFSTLAKRREFCEKEVRLNRRLAPEVYLGVVPVVVLPAGFRMEGPGEALEWAVKMERLPEEATILKRLLRGEVGAPQVEALARTIASFHAATAAGPEIAAFGRFDVVAHNARENFEQSATQVGTALSRTVFERLRAATEATLARLGPLIEARVERGVPRDTHGDLHLDHVYLFPDKPAPADLVIVDCIEFNERFRFADPVADMAFLVMDLVSHGRRDLAQTFAREYFRASGDHEGEALLPFYTAYRAAVRGKVEGFELCELEIPESDRVDALKRAQAHWLLALGELEEADRRPCLVLVGGLPGTGKSTLARNLAERASMEVIRSDAVRKDLAGLGPQQAAPAPFGEGLYAPASTEQTYAECLRRAESALFEGRRVLVDASFGEDRRRRAFVEAGRRLGVPVVLFLCRAEVESVRDRLRQRRGDVSDADWSIYHQTAEHWEPMSPSIPEVSREVQTDGPPEQSVGQALDWLRQLGLTC